MSQIVYVLTLKTWFEYDRPHHTYARIHWDAGYPCEHYRTIMRGFDDIKCEDCGADHSRAGLQSSDALGLPDEDGMTSIRHDTREEAIASALRWFRANARECDALVVGTWTLCGWAREDPYEVLAGEVES